jgi:AcrR family transcriptional regulator
MEAENGILMEIDAGTRAVVTGRPRQMHEADRRRHLIAAAADLYLHKGYHATTMDDVARCAGMSKKTVYQVFCSKSELFDALLSDWFAPFTAPIEADGPPQQVLTSALSRLANFALSERQVLLMRLLIAETSCTEEIAAALDRQCIGRGRSALEQWVAGQAARGVLKKVGDPKEAANMLFFAVVGDFLLRLLLRNRPSPAAEEIRSRIDYTVAAFFRLFG